MVLSHFFPLEVGMPSVLRVLAMSRVLLPRRAMSTPLSQSTPNSAVLVGSQSAYIHTVRSRPPSR